MTVDARDPSTTMIARGVRASVSMTLIAMLMACGDSPPAPPVPVKLAFLASPASQTAGAAVTPAITVAIQDDAGRTVTSAAATVTLTIASNPASGALSGTTTVAAVNGVATFNNVSIDKAGVGYTLSASATGLTPATSNPFTVTPAAASRIQFLTQPSDAVAGMAVSPAIRVGFFDAFDNPATTSAGSVTLAIASNAAGGTLAGTTTVSPVNGVATFGDVSVDKAGTGYTLSATSGSLAGVVSSAFNVAAGPPSKLAFITQPTTTEGAQPINPAVRVVIQDAYANTVTSATSTVTVQLGENPGSAAIFGTTSVNAIGGVATFSNLRIDRPGTGYTLTAAAGSLTAATSAQFNVTLTFAAISAGGTSSASGHSCGVTTAGAAYCWGANAFGQLGNGTTVEETRPTLVSGGLTFASVSAGSNHTCGVTTGGVAYCWGANGKGQLGDGTTSQRTNPTAVTGASSFALVSAGDLYGCGVTTAGAAHCWGYNADGQLGDGTTTDNTTPVLVAGSLTFVAVSADSAHTCGVTTAGGAYCWGSGARGRLGDGTTTNRTTPNAVSGGLTFGEIVVGVDHTCGVTTGGAAYCWGGGDNGQLGNGDTANRFAPSAVSGATTYRSIGAGWYHNCATTTANAAYCWGYNANHQLGDGTVIQRSSPVTIGGGIPFARIDGARYHTCGVTTAGAAYCWGNNNNGQLGEGTRTERETPVRVIQ